MIEAKIAHICPLCQSSFMGSSDILKVCPKCMRKHNLDLAFEEMFRHRSVEMLALLNKSSADFLSDMAKTFKESKKKLRRMGIFNLVYLTLGIVFWILSRI